MTLYAKGEFEVKLVPQTEERAVPLLGRLSIDKVFHGDIVGSSEILKRHAKMKYIKERSTHYIQKVRRQEKTIL